MIIKAFSWLAVAAIVMAPTAHSAQTGEQCYQKLLYRICEDDQGHWRIDPIPALPLPGPPAPPPSDQNGV